MAATPKTFQPGDGITGRCELCDVEVTEPLPAGEPYDRDVATAATKRVCEWMDAHYAEFHPDSRDPFDLSVDLKEGS